MLRTAALLREETELLDGLVDAELAGRDRIARRRLAELPPALARLVVVRLAEDAAGGVRAPGGRSGGGDRGAGRARRACRGAARRAVQAGAVIARGDRCRCAGFRLRSALDSAGVATPARVRSRARSRRGARRAPRTCSAACASWARRSRATTPAAPLLLVGVLKGAVFFLSDLMRFIDIPVEVDFMAVASYGSATDSSGVVRILKDLDVAIEGRDVLIVEDIVDSGLTLQYLLRNLGSRNPARSRCARC